MCYIHSAYCFTHKHTYRRGGPPTSGGTGSCGLAKEQSIVPTAHDPSGVLGIALPSRDVALAKTGRTIALYKVCTRGEPCLAEPSLFKSTHDWLSGSRSADNGSSATLGRHAWIMRAARLHISAAICLIHHFFKLLALDQPLRLAARKAAVVTMLVARGWRLP